MGKGLIIGIVIGVVVLGIFIFALGGKKYDDGGVALDISQGENEDDDHEHAEGIPDEHGHDASGEVMVKENGEAMEKKDGEVPDEIGGTDSIVIAMSSSGFQPSTLTINVGDTVVFINAGSGSYWPATDVHPSHTDYPGSGINKCGTQKGEIFDACDGIGAGESYSFTFDETGSWGYHDHLRASRKGTIVVQ